MKGDKAIRPVKVSKDIWLYPCERHFEFVVYYREGASPVQFRITRAKLKELINL